MTTPSVPPIQQLVDNATSALGTGQATMANNKPPKSGRSEAIGRRMAKIKRGRNGS